jgi:hypothetical protein
MGASKRGKSPNSILPILTKTDAFSGFFLLQGCKITKQKGSNYIGGKSDRWWEAKIEINGMLVRFDGTPLYLITLKS